MCHLFYEELAPEFQRYFQNISFPFDTFITTDKTSKRAKIESFFAGWQYGAVDVRIAENRGRDIAPKLVALKDVYETYDYVLHVHSKRSVHSSPLANWRHFLLENLVGSPDVVNSVFDAFWRKSDLGMVASQHFEPIREEIIWRGNFKIADVLAKRMGVSLSSDAALDFPAGSMFWARTSALKPLLELKLRFDEFAQETGQRDGTLAHAIERLYFFACERAGFNWIKIARPELFTETAGIFKIEVQEALDELIIQNRLL